MVSEQISSFIGNALDRLIYYHFRRRRRGPKSPRPVFRTAGAFSVTKKTPGKSICGESIDFPTAVDDDDETRA